MINAPALLADARKTVNVLVEDLRRVAATDPDAIAHVDAEYQRAHAAGRTAFGHAEWAEGLFAQVAVAWTLGCVFVRFCEDNDLIAEPLLGGPGLRSQLALDQRAVHLHAEPAHDDRHWLREVFGRLRRLPATGELFGTHNPIWLDGLLPSADGARRLREDLTRIDPDTGQLRHDFRDPTWDTRFLGDLYQDLSDHAKKTYALLQTPVFVEEFILDRTLDPAVATFGLAETTIIDPTCGSGHFLLGAFDRLFERWLAIEPGTNRRVLAQRTLDAIGGIDLNPFAASIARFRLLLAAIRAGGDAELANSPAYDLNIAVGDSLLHGDPPGALPGLHIAGQEELLLTAHGYAVEDHSATRELLSRGWSAVVGNPPYIVVKDPALNAAYRQRFTTCSGKYSLGVPFTERFWQLARQNSDPGRAGYVGLITANSFMKREMGKKLIEQWVPGNDLTHIIDISGAYIPGHGTPTVILLGRNRLPVETFVRTAMGILGEPSRPIAPEKGLVWSSIVELIDEAGAESSYISVVDLPRSRLSTHPWSIGGGGAADLKDRLDGKRVKLGSVVDSVGFHVIAGLDDVFFGYTSASAARLALGEYLRRLGTGERVRDWAVRDSEFALFPYSKDLEPAASTKLDRHLWPYRTYLANALMFGKTRADKGQRWTEYAFVSREREEAPLLITFANVTTHNHFVLERDGRLLT